jgi:ATP synthase protein I
VPERRPDLRHDRFARQVGSRERRKLWARRHVDRSVWFGLGMYGLVGWSVAIPTVIGVAVGVWVDTVWPGRFSWTLMLLSAGLIVGCWNAWYWVSREQRAIGRHGDEDREEDAGRD